MGNHRSAMLGEVLPYNFIKYQEKFIRLVPEYLEPFNKVCNDRLKFDKTTLPEVVYRLCETNYPFIGFLAAFHELHEHLSYKDFDKYGLGFREIRPLDHYALLAIHAEGCLRRKSESLNKSKNQGLVDYIKLLGSSQRNLQKVINCYSPKPKRKLTRLHAKQSDPIGDIQSIPKELSDTEHQILQAFFCCELARNYFAHHDYLNHELTRSDKSQFLLRGILLTLNQMLAIK